MTKIIQFAKSNAMVIIAWVAAIISMFFVPPDSGYSDYFDWQTLACLFLTLLVVGAFTGIHTFEIASRRIVQKLKNTRRLILAVVFITYVGSMILANDMALITFLPLGWLSLKNSGNQKHTAFVFIMQNIAANLGGMLTPFGNPQNLYLYSYYNIPTLEFFGIMFPPFLLSLGLIIGCCMLIKPEPLSLQTEEEFTFRPKRTAIYSALFIISVMTVFEVVPWYISLVGVSVAVAVADIHSFGRVSYSLLLTFCAFFILSGNIARIDAIKDALMQLTAQNTLLTGVLSCQIISNVPTAVLLSHFATNYAQLLVAVNIGGAGTLIASLASLITFNKFKAVIKGKTLMYIGLFSLINFAFLALLFALEWVIFFLI